jgi:hypothetical protein
LFGTATFQNLPAGTYAVSATYAGDANFLASTSVGYLFAAVTVVATAPPGPLIPTTLNVSANPPFLNYPLITSFTTFTATVTGGNGSTVPPTGSVTVFSDGEAVSFINLSASGATSAAGTAQGPSFAEFFDYGVNQITAVYSGDSVYKSSTNAASTFSYSVPETPDFTFTPQLPQITVQAGSSGTVGLNMSPLDGFNGVVTLTCATSSSNVSCGVNPSTPVLNGSATATLKISALANAGAQVAQLGTRPGGQLSLLGTGSGLAFASALLLGFTNRKRRISALLNVCLMGALFAGLFVVDGCGGGGSQIVQPPAPPPPPTPAPSTAGVTYTVVVSATANGIIHNAKISVVVP